LKVSSTPDIAPKHNLKILLSQLWSWEGRLHVMEKFLKVFPRPFE
jgi:hypothetical protein